MTASESLLFPAAIPNRVTKVVSDAALDPDVLRYAREQAAIALHRFSTIRSVEILVASNAAVPATCRLRVVFSSGVPVVVGHSAPGVLHAIDTAVETAAHIIEGRLKSRT